MALNYLKRTVLMLLMLLGVLVVYFIADTAFVLLKIENYFWEPKTILIESKIMKPHSVIVKPLTITHKCRHMIAFEPDNFKKGNVSADIFLTIVNSAGKVSYSQSMGSYGYSSFLDSPVLEPGDYKIFFFVSRAPESYPFENFTLNLNYHKDGCQMTLIKIVPEQIRVLLSKDIKTQSIFK
nr:hypothetical protein [uncultured Enterobacter sp.]